MYLSAAVLSPLGAAPDRLIAKAAEWIALGRNDPLAERLACVFTSGHADLEAGLGIGETELTGIEIHIRPAQGQDLALTAAGQHQQADRRRGHGRGGSVVNGLVQHPSQPGELRIGQETLARTLGVLLDRPAGIAAFRHQAPALAQPVHVRPDLDGLVRRDRAARQLVVELDDTGSLQRRHRDPAEDREDVAVEQTADPHLRSRFQPHRDMLFEIAPGQVGHGRAAVEPGGERQGHRFLARLDAGDDERGPLACPVGVQHVVTADLDAYRIFPVDRSACLSDVDLAARRIDPDPEAGAALGDGRRCPGPRTCSGCRLRGSVPASRCSRRWYPCRSSPRTQDRSRTGSGSSPGG